MAQATIRAAVTGTTKKPIDIIATYWIDPSRWGRGLASAALDAFAQIELTRPLFARVAEHYIGSAKVLARAGFVQVGSDTAHADGVGRDVVEHIYRLDESRSYAMFLGG